MFLHNMLNVLVQIGNKMGFKKKSLTVARNHSELTRGGGGCYIKQEVSDRPNYVSCFCLRVLREIPCKLATCAHVAAK
jgi:hypothetical protein